MSKKKLITEKELLSLKFLRSFALSPDEKEIVYVLEWIDEKDNKYYSNLWLVGTDGKNNRQFTFGKYKDSSPVWSPDGKKIAFVSKRGEKAGLHIIHRDGGEANKLVEEEGAFQNLSWSPDGRFILCALRKSEIHKDKEGKKVAPVFREIGRLFYRLDGDGWLPKDRFHVWKYEVATGKGTQLTKGRYEEVSPAFSPDGKQICFVSNRQPDPDLDTDRLDLYLISSEGKNFRKVAAPDGPKAEPAWSPEGKKVAYLAHTNTKDAWGVTNFHIWVVDPGKKGSAKDLTPKLDRMCLDLGISDTGEAAHGGKVSWSRDGKRLFFMITDKGSVDLWSVTLGGKMTQITKGKHRVTGFDTNGKVNLIAYSQADFTSCGDLYMTTPAGRSKRLTEVNRDWFNQFQVQIPEEHWFLSMGGQKLQGWIIKPPNFNPKRKYPAVVEVHGGPRVQYGNVFMYEFQYLAAKGYVVFYCNPRGSQGYGEKFAGCIVKAWGTYDYQDVMAGTDFLISKPYADKSRIGITGGSYGGYMTNWVVGHTNRFKAAVTQRSVVNLVSFFGSSDIGFEDWREFGGRVWENWDHYLKMSPIYYVRNVRTPLLIIHNEGDLRCPIEQAEQLFTALKVLKRKVAFVRFPEEFHGLSRSGRPDRRLERLRRIGGWFNKYLK
jgi:dipeptidyl aminopeptidase/acylaminoacyl peptidase